MPNDPLKALNTPNTGDLTGAWGTAAVNPNFTVIGGYLGGVATVSLTNANVSLSIGTGVIGTGSITPGAGPVQAANAVLKFAGTLSGNCAITFPCPGFWIVKNNCTVGAFYVQARASGTGNVIGLPPGMDVHIYNDGTDCSFCDLGMPGQFLDLCVSTTPAWMNACTVLPYLPCVGTATYSSSLYPALFAMLGSTFGGNGINNFGVPDLSGRTRIPLDFSGARITFAGSAITGTLLGATGGAQNQTISTAQMPSHTHAVTDPGHTHNLPYRGDASGGGGGGVISGVTFNATATVTSNTTGISLGTTGGTTPVVTVQPALMFGVSFIKT